MDKFTKIFKVLLCVICLLFIIILLWMGFLTITGVVLMNFVTLEVAGNIGFFVATILIAIIFVILFKS